MNLDPSRYADLFRTESREQLAVINRALLSLESGIDSGIDAAEPVGEIFRAVHTVKGMSATMGYQAVAEFSHEMESLLDRIRRGEQQLAPELMDALSEVRIVPAADEVGVQLVLAEVALG